MSDRLNILIIHRMGDPLWRRQSVEELEHQLPLCCPDNNYIVHDDDLPIPEYLTDFGFDAIVLGPTFLCNRHSGRALAKTQERYGFVRTSSAFTIARPQDDYDSAGVLDRWMANWRINQVYTVCPDHWNILYPEYLAAGGDLKLGYTGHIAAHDIEEWASPKPFEQRAVDVSYRSHEVDRHFGSLGFHKAYIGKRFAESIGDTSLTLDISTSERDLIPGNAWRRFLENSRFCVSPLSGSSLFDPEGDIRRAIARYQSLHPRATFADVEQACFPGKDRQYIFTAISPRNMEAALACTVQLAAPGPYNGILQPWDHYIPLEPDCSNIAQVLNIMRDTAEVLRITQRCKETILDHRPLRASYQASQLLRDIRDARADRGSRSQQDDFDALLGRYRRDVIAKADGVWARKRWARNVAIRLGGRRVKPFLESLEQRVTSRRRGL